MPVEREGPIKEEKEVAAGDAWGNVLAAKVKLKHTHPFGRAFLKTPLYKHNK